MKKINVMLAQNLTDSDKLLYCKATLNKREAYDRKRNK
jgi:hypothetical protein